MSKVQKPRKFWLRWISQKMLSQKGYKLRELIAEAGFEVTPGELEEALLEAHDRIGGGRCRFCGEGDENTELRYGMCFKCFMNG